MKLLAGFAIVSLFTWVAVMLELSHNDQTRRIR